MGEREMTDRSASLIASACRLVAAKLKSGELEPRLCKCGYFRGHDGPCMVLRAKEMRRESK